MKPPLPRRALLAAVPALSAATASDWVSLGREALGPIRDSVTAADGPVLLKSWVTSGTTPFDRVHQEAAYTYDNALAGLALLAGGEPVLARRVAEGLRLAQAQDRFWTDGRLRNAYAAGRQYPDAPASARLPGWWDATTNRWLEDGYHAGSAAGPVAFAILLWTALGDPAFVAAAAGAADWLETLRAPEGYLGGTIGHEPQPQPLPWRSTEQNLDLAVAFARLGRRDAANHAAAFVRGMWTPNEGRFFAGRLPDGGINGHSALDANLWPLLAWPEAQPFRPAFEWVLSRHGLPEGAPRAEMDGLDFDADRDGIWLEGTAQAALLLRLLGEEGLATRLAATIRRHRGPGGWILAASVPSLSTGLATGLVPGTADFRYPRQGHLAANAWAALAAFGVNPFAP